jgi:hypothetical protein
MENKYYTPSIEEFYVGFECEVKDLSGNFIPFIHNKESICFADIFRVKYLDKEDIESLGFTHLPKKSLKGLTERFSIEGLHKRLNEEYDDTMWWNVYLEYSPDIKRVIIKGDISNGEYNEKFFEGVIKNKSELKVLLKQLGII